MSPPKGRTGPGERAGSKSNADDGGHRQGTADVIDQAIAAACAIRGCGCHPDITVTRDGAIRRVTVAHDDWCAAIGGDAA